MAEKSEKVPAAEIRQIATDACLACGGGPAMTRSLVDATLSAERTGRREVGFAHFLDYLHSLRAGRIDGKAEPSIEHPLPAVIHSDAQGGIAQLGFDLAFDGLTERARTFGIALFTQNNSYTAGELGYYVRRLAERGLVSMAVSNTHAMMAAAVGGKPIFGTNPLAFGAPLPPPRAPLVVDQATSATAFVNIVRAAAEKTSIPAGWAVDKDGVETTDPAEAMLGALLPFGGYKGANIALMIDVLAAGLAGASWSLDAGDFRSGNRCPNTGLAVVALSPRVADPDFANRVADLLDRLEKLDVRIPGTTARRDRPDEGETVEIDASILAAIRGFIA